MDVQPTSYTVFRGSNQLIRTHWEDALQAYVSSCDNYCGCPDCNDPIGYGKTKEESIEDLLESIAELEG